jgi:hypothetical protein
MFHIIRAILRFFGIIIIRLEQQDTAADKPVFTIPFGIAGDKPPGLEPPPVIKE